MWALEVLADGTLVSGDQEGAVQFWDGRFGTLLTRHQQFAADVLTLAASPDGKMVWASGVDPKVGSGLGFRTFGILVAAVATEHHLVCSRVRVNLSCRGAVQRQLTCSSRQHLGTRNCFSAVP